MSKIIADLDESAPAAFIADGFGVALRLGLLAAIALAGGFAARLLI